MLGQFGLHITGAGKGRKAGAKQRQRQACGVLIGVEPDDQHTKNSGQQGPCRHARTIARQAAAGVHHSGKTRQCRTQHDALGAQIDDAGLLIDQQAQSGNRQHRARVQ